MRQLIWVILLGSGIYIAGGIQQTNCLAADPAPRPMSNNTSPHLLGTNYIIGPGDVLDISVWKEAALTKLVIVLPDGKISFPLIGEVGAAGLTIAQLKQQLEDKLTRFVPHPNLSVAVHQVNSLQVYVIGKVNNPGRYSINTELNVLQALAIAGGLNAFAKKNKIKIFRERPEGTQIFEFRYGDVTEGKHLEQNIRLMRGDVIVVP
jgi:polysaccharide export outer membrane protein